MVKTARLAAVSSLVPFSNVVVDVGSDHALLGIDLIKKGKAQTVINVEKAEGPLQAGIANVKKAGLEARFAHFLSDGFASYKGPKEIDTIVLAGFGGKSMAAVIANADVNWKHVVAQPSNNAAALRKFAAEANYAIDAEQVVFDGRFYELVRLVKRPGTQLDENKIFFGPINLQNRDAAFIACWKQRMEHLQRMNNKANRPHLTKQIALIKQVIN